MFQQFKNLYHLFQAILANLYYGFPSRKLKVIGVTGTDGKTTTTHLIYYILKSNGKKVSMISSVYAQVGEKEFDTGFHVTTPDVFPLQKLLLQSVQNGDEYFVLETTSHALFQNRVFGIRYEIGVLTNVTHEHLDMHHTLEEYTRIKLKLLQRAKYAVTNEDDQSYKQIKDQRSKIKDADRKSKIFTYSLRHPELVSGSDFKKQMLKRVQHDMAEFNQYNYLAAYKVCKILGLSDEEILSAMRTFKLPKGRYEVISTKPVTAIIDFAHTPNGIYEILKDVRKRYVKKGNKLIHVFGSAGKRDQTKRSSMGEASGAFSDFVILTEEDYRDEDPIKICNEIAIGLKKKGKPYSIIVDRKKAIKKAFEIAQKGDVVIATGKGHETSLCRGDKEYPWDERKVFYDNLRS
jgi:UDP-N-acetylmuramoyl-L-alanyl-D-glutamate--2,6-diaminopimelate ligase